MKNFSFKTKQLLPLDINNAWSFFSNPHNLKEITPGWLNFRIINNKLPESIFKGLIIKYKVNPVLGIPINWVTEIAEVNKPFSFTDEQKKGPYKLWRHKHLFTQLPEGTEITDIVEYALPFGITGGLINKFFVSNKVIEIFEYRKNVLTEKFG